MGQAMATYLATRPIDLRDPALFGSFYDEALPDVYAYVLRRCGGSAEAAEELTRAVFLTAARQITEQGVAKLSLGWITGIARGLLIERYRAAFQNLPRRRFWQRGKDDQDDLPEFCRVVDPALAVAALNQLPDAERIVVTLRYLDDLRLPEIAAITEQPLSTVEALLQRGRAAFERIYLEHGDADARSNVGSAGVSRSARVARFRIHHRFTANDLRRSRRRPERG